jgi:hypothetical protein
MLRERLADRQMRLAEVGRTRGGRRFPLALDDAGYGGSRSARASAKVGNEVEVGERSEAGGLAHPAMSRSRTTGFRHRSRRTTHNRGYIAVELAGGEAVADHSVADAELGRDGGLRDPGPTVV